MRDRRSIPTSLVMLFLLSRQEQAEEKREQQRQAPTVPTIMIVNPSAGMAQPYFGQPNAGQYYPPMGMPMNAGGRQFYLLGAEDGEER